MKNHILSLALILLSVACTKAPTPLPNGKGGVATFWQLGGKFTITYSADGSMMMTGDNEISMQHAMQAATALGLSYIDYLGLKVTELTSQLANQNLTAVQQAQIQADLSKYTALLNAEKASKGIGAGAPLGPVNFE